MRLALFVHGLDDRAVSRLNRAIAGHLVESGQDVAIVSASRDPSSVIPVPRGVEIVDLGGERRHTWHAARGLALFLSRWRPDVLFAHGDGPSITSIAVRALTRSRTRIVSVHHTHERTFHPERRPFRRAIASRMLPRADTLAAPSPYVLSDLVRTLRGAPRRTAVLPPPGPEPDAVARAHVVVPEHPWFAGSERRHVVTCVGNLVKRKDQATLVRALPMVRDAVGDVRLVLVGREDDPAYASSLRRMAAAAGLEGAIWWAGYVRDPLPIIAHSDALASASHTEAGPIALLEAMACGVPVVSTDCPAGPRYLTDEARAGLLVPMRDPGAMASAIIRVLTEPELRGELIASGRSRAAAFEPRRVAERYLAEAEALTRRAPITVAAGSRR